jgi:hypothetical protein
MPGHVEVHEWIASQTRVGVGELHPARPRLRDDAWTIIEKVKVIYIRHQHSLWFNCLRT